MDSLLSSLITAANTLHEGIIITDSKLNVLYANLRALTLLDITERELMRKPLIWVSNEFSKGAIAMDKNKPFPEHRFIYKDTELSVSFYPATNSATGENSLCIQLNDLRTHQTLKAKESDTFFYFDALDTIMNNVNDWIVIVDQNGIITTMSRPYKEFLQHPSPEGKHVTEVIENTRMHQVIETGIPEMDDVHLIRGNKMIVSRIPIIQNGIVVGAVGKSTFKDIDDFYTLFNKLSKLQKKVQTHPEDSSPDSTAKYSFENIIGDSPSTLMAVKMAQKAAQTDSNVLIIGDSGTGKELFAHAVHSASPRSSKPFITINCAAIPSELLESELFGYEHGAFSGARKQGKKGKFELANTGTIFLDEIGDMPLEMQAKLLRVLQEKELDRVGGDTPIKIDARVIAATNQNVEAQVQEGKFRGDLYYRLNVMRLNLTPLRERKEEIPDIANEILRKLTQRMDLIVYGFTPEAMNALQDYSWPGNVRELENILERALNLLENDLYIKESLLPEYIRTEIPSKQTAVSALGYSVDANLHTATGEIEKDLILKALKETGGNKKKAAALLGISRAGLYKKLESYSISL